MKNNKKIKSSKLLKSFEIWQSSLSKVTGGAPYSTEYTIPGSAACSFWCPDGKVDEGAYGNPNSH